MVVMTREEFIKGYYDRSGIAASERRPDGFQIGSHRRVAVPCDCGEDDCQGWQMMAVGALEDVGP